MAIAFAAIVPHSPLLIPSIAEEKAEALRATYASLHTIALTAAELNVRTIVMLSAHHDTKLTSLILNVRPTYHLSYREFGDYSTLLAVRGATSLGNALKQPFDTRRHELPLAVVSEEVLDYGFTTPLFHFLRDLPELAVLPLSDTLPPAAREFAYGPMFTSHLVEYPEKIGIIASANLSHRLSNDSPAGFSPRAKAFDKRILEAIQKGDAVRISRTRPETIREVAACGLGVLELLFGMIAGQRYSIEQLSYEAPYGIGMPSFLLRLS